MTTAGGCAPRGIGELGDLQLAILHILWERGETSVREVLEALPGERRHAYTTVLTVLRNLEKRGLVEHAKENGARRFLYRPGITLAEARTDLVAGVLDRLFANTPALLVEHLLTTRDCSPQAVRDILAAFEADSGSA